MCANTCAHLAALAMACLCCPEGPAHRPSTRKRRAATQYPPRTVRASVCASKAQRTRLLRQPQPRTESVRHVQKARRESSRPQRARQPRTLCGKHVRDRVVANWHAVRCHSIAARVWVVPYHTIPCCVHTVDIAAMEWHRARCRHCAPASACLVNTRALGQHGCTCVREHRATSTCSSHAYKGMAPASR